MKVLDIGSGGGSTYIKAYYPDVDQIIKLDIDRNVKPNIVHDITKPLPRKYQGKFDAAVCFHMLEHINRRDVVSVMRNIADAVRYKGEVVVTVPSLEWAANEIMNGRDSLGVQGILYGAQTSPHHFHKIGFTLNALEQVISHIGILSIDKSFQQEIIVIVDGQRFDAVHNVVKAVRR